MESCTEDDYRNVFLATEAIDDLIFLPLFSVTLVVVGGVSYLVAYLGTSLYFFKKKKRALNKKDDTEPKMFYEHDSSSAPRKVAAAKQEEDGLLLARGQEVLPPTKNEADNQKAPNADEQRPPEESKGVANVKAK